MLPEAENEPKRPRSRSGAPATKPFSTGRVLAIVFGFSVALIASIYLFHRLEQFLIRDPRFALSGVEGDAAAIEIAGAAHASRPQIEKVFAIDLARSVYLLPLAERRDALKSVDWVKDASIARIWPNRVVVAIQERKPVAFLTLGPSRFALIDDDGVILPPAPDRFTLPVLTGVRASSELTDRRDRVHRMLRLTKELGADARNISEVDVADRDNLKVTAPHSGHIVTLLMGDRNFGLRYQNFVNHFGEIQRRLPNAATLDLRLEDRITVVE